MFEIPKSVGIGWYYLLQDSERYLNAEDFELFLDFASKLKISLIKKDNQFSRTLLEILRTIFRWIGYLDFRNLIDNLLCKYTSFNFYQGSIIAIENYF